MKLLVVSDTHGDYYNFNKVIEKHRDIDIIVHCGDSRDEIDELKLFYPNKKFVCVRGNCDLSSMLPTIETIRINSKTIFITHGHEYYVKHSLNNLVCAAKEQGASLVLFGHTHNAVSDFDDGLHILNPGSLSGYNGSYAIADVTENGIVTNILSIK